ncbi:hypothetical protein ASPWEDRAFT_41183 [Aspergillus wentii DTO 134E9]|uniref:ATP-grasp domain-containing protein n=1 Tax=Aspergillus wentii DTO 134E9 TaxID=1073089 RepID=A0A1L9RLZ2_ASPWE|nr:uncharacterized protein ASPWEDRAFT_41183 [Aspergillus wentii DTO 134E9]OJJ35959.1 hypothetical protein ASPWEDRAFT_41183 [Aspergillus wentii DTO 134E9]
MPQSGNHATVFKEKLHLKKNPPSLSRQPPNVLLTNGRFPVSLDLARQLNLAGYNVYCVDPMRYHVCRFSRMVKASKTVPPPRSDPEGYIKAVSEAVRSWEIQFIIPVHEEEFCLAESKDPTILARLYAPPWENIMLLHSKWEFSRLMQAFGLDVPMAYLCESMDDIQKLDQSIEWAVKPVFGRASTNVHHLRPGDPPPSIQVSKQARYIAQEWVRGTRYCSYSVFDHGSLRAHGVYPVLETIDGSSCVYFEACSHPGIREYVERLAACLFPLHGQIGLDFVETEDRLVTIDCNPRATSGIHLWTGTPYLARAMVGRLGAGSINPPFINPDRGVKTQVLPGMLMWEHRRVNMKRYLKHLWRLIRARDVIWKWTDFMPSLASPFLLSYYYKLCWRHHLTLPELFQWDLIWEPTDELLEKVGTLRQRVLGGQGHIEDGHAG